jgi:hypothetical protein
MLSQVGIGAEPKNGGSAKFGLVQSATTDTMDLGILNTRTQAPVLGPCRTASWKSTRRATLSVRAAARERRPMDVLGAGMLSIAEGKVMGKRRLT